MTKIAARFAHEASNKRENYHSANNKTKYHWSVVEEDNAGSQHNVSGSGIKTVDVDIDAEYYEGWK